MPGKGAFYANKKHPHGRGEDATPPTTMIGKRETPPRAWGRQSRFGGIFFGHRNTPTGVGKTLLGNVTRYILEKHPHGRGEDRSPLLVSPRCRRNTPTGVGKTTVGGYSGSPLEKHPHGRGEDPGYGATVRPTIETPPRAWGRLLLVAIVGLRWRNTPTGVGKTQATEQQSDQL